MKFKHEDVVIIQRNAFTNKRTVKYVCWLADCVSIIKVSDNQVKALAVALDFFMARIWSR